MDDTDGDIRQLALRRQRQRLQRPPSNEALINTNNKWDPNPYEGFLDGRQVTGTRGLLTLDDENRTSRMHVPPVIKCECNGVEAIAVISTSTISSTMSMEMVEKLRLTDQIIPDTRTANSPLSTIQPRVKGKIKYVDLSIGVWQQVSQFFVVDNTPPDISLGVDFLRKTQSVVNFEETSLFIGGVKGSKVPFLTTRDVLTNTRNKVTTEPRANIAGLFG